MKVHGACLEGPRSVKLVERELTVGETDILVRTHQASICLADVQVYRRGYYVEGESLSFPVFPGHEGGGVVAEVGGRVHEFKLGDAVILMHDVRARRSGPGAMAEYFLARPWDLVPCPPDMDMDLACLGETIAPFVFMVHRSGVRLGDFVVVTGLNFIGQIVAQGVKRSGAFMVAGIDNNDFRLDLAKELGADIVINSDRQDVYEAVMDLTHGRGADVVCQTAAYVDPTVEEYMKLATTLVKPMGILVFQGDFLQPMRLNLHPWHHEALDIRSVAFRHYSWRYIEEWAADTLRPVIYEMINIRRLVTAVYKLDDIAKAYKEASDNPKSLKVIVRP